MKYGLLDGVVDLGAYILGSTKVPLIPYNEKGDWRGYLPQYEYQAENFETQGCTVWGTQNALEILHKFLYKEEPNYSERYTYLLTPIDINSGGNPHNVCECIRKYGLVSQSLLPMTKIKERFLDTTFLDALIPVGKKWLENNDFKHEWVWDPSNRPENYKELLKESLKTSPLGVSVTAWRLKDGLYVSQNGGNNHWCVLTHIDDDGVYHIFDSYDHTTKKLHPDHNIRRAKRFWLNKKTIKASKMHIKILESIIKLFMKPNLLDVCTKHLGLDVTPKDTVDDTVACADTVTTLLGMVRRDTPHMVSTIALNAWLKDHYMLVDVPQPEDIIISPTEGKRIGHVGIVMEDGLIASNNSFGINRGKFTKTHTLDTWTKYYKDKQKLPVFIYRYKI